jgi:hypothetical protein
VKDGNGSIEEALDAALEMTFPASDPIALSLQAYDWPGDARLRNPLSIPMPNRKT